MYLQTNRIFLLLLLLITAIGCSDEEGSNFNFDKSYQSTWTEFSQVRVFTKDGEITDENSVSKVIQRYSKLNTFDFEFLESDKRIETDDIIAIDFNNGISRISSHNQSNEYSFLKRNDFIRFTSLDTLSYVTVDSDFITEHLISHQPLYKKIETIASTTGVSTLITTLPERYAKIQRGQLKFPIIGFFLFRTSEASGSLNGSTNITVATSINNELSETVHRGLSQQDTLLVQQNWLIFE